MRRSRLIAFPLALVAGLLPAAPALAGGTLDITGEMLTYIGDGVEPINVTISLDGDVLRVDENASRITVQPGSGCVVTDAAAYRAECPARGVERIAVETGDAGSDVRIRAALPAHIQGGAGDDLLIGGPADDWIHGGGGKDVIGGGPGADELHGGADDDLVTYVDRIGRDGTLLPRREGVTVRLGARGASGARGEGDTISTDFEMVEGGDGPDRFELRDGRTQSVSCGRGRDVAILDVADEESIDCERGELRGGGLPTLVFPFPAREDSARSHVEIVGTVPLRRNAIVMRIRCQRPIGLLAADGPGCTGRVRMTRGTYVMAERGIDLPRGGVLEWHVPLTTSLRLARRAGGLPVSVSALPTRGAGVRRDLRFTVRG